MVFNGSINRLIAKKEKEINHKENGNRAALVAIRDCPFCSFQ